MRAVFGVLSAALLLSLLPTVASAELRTADVWSGHKVAAGEHVNVALIDFPGDDFIGGCSGSLITRRLVLTAAHCLISTPGQPITVRLGGTSADGKFDEVFISRIHAIHPKYRRNEPAYDFALIRLPRRSEIEPVRLGRYADEEAYTPGKDAWVVGWGGTNDRGRALGELREGKILVRHDDSCASRFGVYDPFSMICLDGQESSGCPGDSGGPVFTMFEGSLLQVGVTSFGQAGCNTGNPRWVAAWTPATSSWITKVIDDGIPRFDTLTYLDPPRESIDRGDRVRLRGLALSDRYGDLLGFQRVLLQRRRANESVWRTIDRKSTDVLGYVTFLQKPVNDVVYRLHHPGSVATRASRSFAYRVNVDG